MTDGSETVPRVTANWILEPALTWVNQPARLTLAICDDGSLQWQRPRLPTHAGRIVRALGEEEGTGERAGEACTLHSFHWALLATRDGAATLAAPMLDAGRFGQRLRFPGPALSYHAAALPAWLPAHAAGRPGRSCRSAACALAAAAAAQLARRGDGRLQRRRYPKALLDLQLRERLAFGVYPPLVEAVAPEDPNSPLSRYAVTFFLAAARKRTGGIAAAALPWYDVAHDQMASAMVPGKTLTVFDPRWQRAGQVAGGLAGVAAGRGELAGLPHRTLAAGAAARFARHPAGTGCARTGGRCRFSLTGQPCAPSLGEWMLRMRRETRASEVEEVP